MEGYTLSEEGKKLIKKYYNSILAVKIIDIVVTFICALLLYHTLDGIFWFPLEILIIWVICVLIYFVVHILCAKILKCNYLELITVQGEPRLFLEVLHGLKRLSRKKQMTPVNMLNVSAAYCHMGQFEKALNSLSDEYINYNKLIPKLRIVYLNNKFACYYESGNWKEARKCFERLKLEVEQFQERTHFSHMILWSERVYSFCRMCIMDYEILTVEGRTYVPNMLANIRDELEKQSTLTYRISLYEHLGMKELALGHYDEAEDAFNTVIKEGKHLWNTEIARQKVRMIHDRDDAIALLQEEEVLQVKSLISQHSVQPVSDEEVRNSIIYVLHAEDNEIAGVARITNEMRFGELIMRSEYDTGKNQFRLMEEMKRRGYQK